jgi:hypothetical protein
VTLFHIAQLAFLLAVVALVVERVRTLSFVSALDAASFRRALSALVRADHLDRATALVRDARPAWVAEVVWPLFDPESPSREDRRIDLEDGLMAVEARAVRGMRILRISASIASALGFIGAASEIHGIYSGDHGILGLQAGLVENLALDHAVVSIALGIATSSLALGAWSLLKNVAKHRIAECRRVVAALEELLFEPGETVGVRSSPSGSE